MILETQWQDFLGQSETRLVKRYDRDQTTFLLQVIQKLIKTQITLSL